MGKIIRLDEHLTNMIAAGEVVERPMGVVKELVENAIDASATQIEIRVVEGGIQEIEVIDNGVGMDKEDASNAFLRHATSKIKTVNDLWSIRTLGFRGEAIPSIASVSKFTMLTSDGNDQTKIEYHYGKVISAKPFACAKGTQIKVEGLFYKTPARLKHLKSVNSETNAIIDLIEKYAFSHPHISFKLVCNDSVRIQTTGNNNLQEVMYSIYGKEVAKNSVAISFNDYDFEVEGIIVLPNITRATRQYITLFINGRVIKNYVIAKAIEEAYREYLSDDRHPICALNIKMDYKLVDVNVHPSKWEIRLTKERQLFALLKEGISAKLHSHMRVSAIEPAVVERSKKEVYETQTLFNDFKIQERWETDSPAKVEKPKPVIENEQVEQVAVESSFPELEVIGQLHGKYILAQGTEGLYIIDQHAAEEKYNYEMFKKALVESKFSMQDLLIPLVVEIKQSKIGQLEEINERVSNIGLHFELFGSNSIVLKSIPSWLQKVELEEFVQDIIDMYDENKNYTVEDIRKEALATMACHFSIKFNRHLTMEEMKKVVENLSACNQPFNCPHGRPTLISIKNGQLIKEFKRA